MEARVVEWYEKNKFKMQALVARFKQSKPPELQRLIEIINRLHTLPTNALTQHIGEIVQLKKLLDLISKSHGKPQQPAVDAQSNHTVPLYNGLNSCFLLINDYLLKNKSDEEELAVEGDNA